MPEIACRRRGGTLVPVDEIAADKLRLAAKDGADVMVEVRSRRNPKQHRFAWALAEKVAQSCEHIHDREDAMDMLKIAARHVRWVTDWRTGEMHPVPKSIAFASCPQAQFSRLMDRFVHIIVRDILPGIAEAELRAEIEAMVIGERPVEREPQRRAA